MFKELNKFKDEKSISNNSKNILELKILKDQLLLSLEDFIKQVDGQILKETLTNITEVKVDKNKY